MSIHGKRHIANAENNGLPCWPDGERYSLGAVLSGNNPYSEIETLVADDFHLFDCRTVFIAMRELHGRGEPVDCGTVTEELERTKQLQRIGGVAFLADLVATPHLVDMLGYVRKLTECRIRRAAYTALYITGDCLLTSTESTASILGSLRPTLDTICSPLKDSPPIVPEWPTPLRVEAFHGLAGDFVRLIEPHTEADPAALLMQLLVTWGSLVGRAGYYLAEADHHHTNEYVCLVGTTSKGRKGTSYGRTRAVLAAVDAYWAEHCLISGVGSGEALIDAFGERAGDKRGLVIEPEFARLMSVIAREGTTLSAIFRTSWDSGFAHIRTRQKKVEVTGVHLSLIAHVTKDELTRRLDDTELANGFANRILWVCTRRSKVLPHGGGCINADDFVRRLKQATEYARRLGNTRVVFDPAARKLWETIYPALSEGNAGLVGAITSRAEAHVVRLSVIYALLDSSPKIREEHLRAALAVWDYCFQSARFIWGDAIGDPMADEILKVIRERAEGVTRWELNNHFSRHKSAAALDRTLNSLAGLGLIRAAAEETGGRPSTRYVTA